MTFIKYEPVRPDWETTWLCVAATIAKRSLCDRDRVGAVIVGQNERVVSTGYNGPPKGFSASRSSFGLETCKAWCPRANLMSLGREVDPTYADCPSIHAEMNAVAYADRRTMEHGTIYVTSVVCFSCAKVIANSGIDRVVMLASSDKMTERNGFATVEFLSSCRVKVKVVQ